MSAPDARTSSGRIALTVAAVPTGMNAGVRISPRSIAITPVRAAPSIAEMEKAKRVTARRLAARALPPKFGCASGAVHVAHRRHRPLHLHRRCAALRHDDHVALAPGAPADPLPFRQGASLLLAARPARRRRRRAPAY